MSNKSPYRQWTIMHPGGHIEEVETATTFGPTNDREFALKRLEIAESDCMCRDDQDERHHVLVYRDMPVPPPWTVENQQSEPTP